MLIFTRSRTPQPILVILAVIAGIWSGVSLTEDPTWLRIGTGLLTLVLVSLILHAAYFMALYVVAKIRQDKEE